MSLFCNIECPSTASPFVIGIIHISLNHRYVNPFLAQTIELVAPSIVECMKR